MTGGMQSFNDLRVALVNQETGAIAWGKQLGARSALRTHEARSYLLLLLCDCNTGSAHTGCKLTIRSGHGAPQLTLEHANGGSIMQCILSNRTVRKRACLQYYVLKRGVGVPSRVPPTTRASVSAASDEPLRPC